VDFETRIVFLLVVALLMLLDEWHQTKLDARRVDPKVGKVGRVMQAIAVQSDSSTRASGQILIEGELWRASADAEIPKGAQVRVTRVSGLTVHVQPTP
jgi:membrane protein implicated in regulation of membrane protease activity